jgi:hypothetical protein
MDARPVLVFRASPSVGAFLSAMSKPKPANASLEPGKPRLDALDIVAAEDGFGGKVGTREEEVTPVNESPKPFAGPAASPDLGTEPETAQASSRFDFIPALVSSEPNDRPSSVRSDAVLFAGTGTAGDWPDGAGEMAGGRPRRMGAMASSTFSLAWIPAPGSTSVRSVRPEVGDRDL